MWRRTVRELTQWVQSVVHSLPVRCTPIVAADANTGVGQDSAGRIVADGDHVGREWVGNQNAAGDALHRLMVEEDLCDLNSFYQAAGLELRAHEHH